MGYWPGVGVGPSGCGVGGEERRDERLERNRPSNSKVKGADGGQGRRQALLTRIISENFYPLCWCWLSITYQNAPCQCQANANSRYQNRALRLSLRVLPSSSWHPLSC